mmetsp:Transcript_20306/g.62944  ORF Transcript_20306/g.62944 Transcript_20306/m.62944 type:complete len:216 (-) Transcript_20306:735-1382(-)
METKGRAGSNAPPFGGCPRPRARHLGRHAKGIASVVSSHVNVGDDASRVKCRGGVRRRALPASRRAPGRRCGRHGLWRGILAMSLPWLRVRRGGRLREGVPQQLQSSAPRDAPNACQVRPRVGMACRSDSRICRHWCEGAQRRLRPPRPFVRPDRPRLVPRAACSRHRRCRAAPLMRAHCRSAPARHPRERSRYGAPSRVARAGVHPPAQPRMGV